MKLSGGGNMSVYEFLFLATDDSADVIIYNLATGGADALMISEAMDKYGDCEVCSFDSYIDSNTLCINIDEEM